MAEQAAAAMLLLSNVRIVFPKLFVGQEEPFGGKGDPYYSASFLVEPNDPQIAAIKAEILRVARAKWGEKAEDNLKIAQAKDKLLIHDGVMKANKPYGDAYKGKLYVSARNNAKTNPPIPVYDNVTDPKTGEARVITSPTDAKAPYSGSFVNVYLNVFAYSNEGEGVAASIAGVQFHADGERLAGGVTAKAGAFKAVPPPAALAKTAAETGQGAKSLF